MLTFTALTYLLAAILAFVASLVMTRVVRDAAVRLGFVDRPDGGRKAHQKPIALGGGLAVFGATLFAVLAAYAFTLLGDTSLFSRADLRLMLGLLTGSVAIVAVGLVDDAVAMRGRYKLICQIAVSLLVIAAGYQIDRVSIFGQEIELMWFAVPFTMFWLLGTTNAINLIDGIDGLASSVGVVLCLTMAAITGIHSHFAETVIMLALAGAQLGFLRYNFAPASVYLGDAGSMFIGLLIGAVAVHTSVKSPAAVAMAVPVAVWSIPILDSAAAILRRKLTGRSVFAADRGHLHHSLLVRGWSVRQAALFIAVICAITCLGAVLSVIYRTEIIALVAVASVMVLLVFTKTFGHIEFALLRDRFRLSSMTLGPRDAQEVARGRESRIRLQGSREWDKLWVAIAESAEDYNLIKVKLSIDIPAIHESFYATWESTALVAIEEEKRWRVMHPLVVDGMTVGRLDIVGSLSEGSGSTLAQIGQVLEFLEPIEEDVRQIREQIKLDKSTMRVGHSDSSARNAVHREQSPSSSEAASASASAAPLLEN